jgi:predicted DNA-binding transcriptional regulator AlpA
MQVSEIHQAVPPSKLSALLIDERAAARLLGLTPRTLQKWRHSGDGPVYVRISSRCIRYRLADLEAWAAARRQRSTSEEVGRG